MQIEVKMGVGSFIKDPKGRYTGGKAERLFQLAMTKYEKVLRPRSWLTSAYEHEVCSR
jgi:hypothetical protein